jgi:hypothetical protein
VVLIALAAATFMLSYNGIHVLALNSGVSPRLARIYPGILDAALVIACLAALMLREGKWWARWYAWLAIIVMVVIGAGTNAIHAMNVPLPHRETAGVISAAPWLLLLLAFSLWLTTLRQSRARRSARSAGMPVPEVPVPGAAETAADTDVRTHSIVPGMSLEPELVPAPVPAPTAETVPAAETAPAAETGPAEETVPTAEIMPAEEAMPAAEAVRKDDAPAEALDENAREASAEAPEANAADAPVDEGAAPEAEAPEVTAPEAEPEVVESVEAGSSAEPEPEPEADVATGEDAAAPAPSADESAEEESPSSGQVAIIGSRPVDYWDAGDGDILDAGAVPAAHDTTDPAPAADYGDEVVEYSDEEEALAQERRAGRPLPTEVHHGAAELASGSPEPSAPELPFFSAPALRRMRSTPVPPEEDPADQP